MGLRIDGDNFALWFGGIWLGVGAPMLVLGLYFGWYYHGAAKELDVHGVTTAGMVLTKSIDTSSSSRDRSSSAPTYWITYRFTTATGDIVKDKAQVDVATWDGLIERHPIQVSYLPSAPRIHRLAGESLPWVLPFIFAAAGAVASTVGVVAVSIGLRARRTATRLFREGITARATVTGVGPSSIRINGVKQWEVRYTFPDSHGRTYRGVSRPMPPEEAEAWDAGQQALVRYDPHAPKQNLWLGSSETSAV
jgi:hypothetical protein